MYKLFYLLLLLPTFSWSHGYSLTCAEERFNYLNQYSADISQLRAIPSNRIAVADNGQVFYCTNVKPKFACDGEQCSGRCGFRAEALIFSTDTLKQSDDLVIDHLYYSKSCNSLFGLATQ